MLLLGLKNTATQTVDVNELVNLGTVYRKYCKSNNGITTFSVNGASLSLQQKGIYHLTAVANVSAPAAGNVVLQLNENGIAIPGAVVTASIDTADTTIENVVLDYYFLVDSDCVLGYTTNNVKNITISNTGIEATIVNIVVNVDKVL